MTPAQRIMRAADRAGWTDRETAQRLGVTMRAVRRWRERARKDAGRADGPDGRAPHEAMVRLAELLADGATS